MRLGCEVLLLYLGEEVAGRVVSLPNAYRALESSSLGQNVDPWTLKFHEETFKMF